MPLRNRVNPAGEICVASERGTLMGNRGRLHNDRRELVRTTRSPAWITCLTSFEGRRRTVMGPGSYTELFFLDEATALAAGHRPCAECRRARYDAFRTAWRAGVGGVGAVRAADMDRTLRRDRSPAARISVSSLDDLPDGVLVRHDDTFHLVHGGAIRPWSFAGYGAPIPFDAAPGPFMVLTPGCTVEVLRHGYVAAVHPSVDAPVSGRLWR